MTVYPSLRDAAVERCERVGFDVREPTTGPPVLATPTRDVRSPFAGERPVAVDPLPATEANPDVVVPRLSTAVGDGRNHLFVVADAETATRIAGMFRSPVAVASETDVGHRTFYNGPDRVALDPDGYACTTSDPAGLVWCEEPLDEDEDRTGTDYPSLVLRDGTETLAVLDGVAALACPPADAFQYRYRRDADAKFFEVYEGDRRVGTYAGVRAMRDAGFHPVPMPLVPERVFSERIRGRWAVLSLEDDRVLTDEGAADWD